MDLPIFSIVAKGSDLLYGEAGQDWLYANSAYDTLYGGEGDDFLYGRYETSLLNGGEGDDVLDGSGILIGGTGADRFVFNVNWNETARIEDLQSNDTIVLQTGESSPNPLSVIQLAHSGDTTVITSTVSALEITLVGTYNMGDIQFDVDVIFS